MKAKCYHHDSPAHWGQAPAAIIQLCSCSWICPVCGYGSMTWPCRCTDEDMIIESILIDFDAAWRVLGADTDG